MAICAICGDDGNGTSYPKNPWWSPDDGWRHGALCSYCKEDIVRARPKPDDFAWDKRGEYDADSMLAENDTL